MLTEEEQKAADDKKVAEDAEEERLASLTDEEREAEAKPKEHSQIDYEAEAKREKERADLAIHNFLKYCKQRGIRSMNYGLIKVPKAKARSYTPVTKEDYKRLLSFCCVTEYRELQKTLIIRLLWDTGMRISELCDLDISSMQAPKLFGIVRTKKNGQLRMIFWSKETNELLLKYLGVRLCLNQQPALFQGLYKGESPSQRMTPRTAQRSIAELVRRAGLESRISAHSFRHGRAHQIINLGGTVSDVSQILGHLNPASSFVYLQMNNLELEKRARRYL